MIHWQFQTAGIAKKSKQKTLSVVKAQSPMPPRPPRATTTESPGLSRSASSGPGTSFDSPSGASSGEIISRTMTPRGTTMKLSRPERRGLRAARTPSATSRTFDQRRQHRIRLLWARPVSPLKLPLLPDCPLWACTWPLRWARLKCEPLASARCHCCRGHHGYHHMNHSRSSVEAL